MVRIAAFYRFAPLADPEARATSLRRLAEAEGLKGTAILAPEGVNGTLAGPRAGIAAALAHLRAWPGFADLSARESRAAAPPFARLRIRVKPEIVTMGAAGIDPRVQTGTHVDPERWNALLADPAVAVIDTRNTYETAIGSFLGAEDPGLERFRDFPAWWASAERRLAGRPVALFCTGGIRCEKATSHLRARGLSEIYHLDGGILRYLAQMPAERSLWHGACFVFDGRVAVGPGLSPSGHALCHACGGAVSQAARARPEWEDGVSCHRCHGRYSAADRARFRERQRQLATVRAPLPSADPPTGG